MAAAMNGMALHGGVIPYGGTFMVFSDYSRPAIRLGALMGVRAIHVLTHDSIGLGEDGPTHQPVEHLAALRAIPNLLVFRPADTVEAMECWQIALEHKAAPSAMALSRQKTPAVRTVAATENLSARGAYEIRAAKGEAKVTLFGTGTELALALAAADALEAEGTPTRVVSVPCFELFFQQDAAIPGLGHRPRDRPRRRRGRDPAGLGAVHRRGRRLRRHDRFRRLGPGRGAVREVRRHDGRRGRSGQGAALEPWLRPPASMSGLADARPCCG
jgi:hypothetical protein